MDLGADYLLIDDPVTVSYAVKTGEGAFAPPAAVAYCQSNAVTKADLTANPKLLETDAAVYHLWAVPLGGIVPKLGDKLAHGGRVWVVAGVGEHDRDAAGVQRYRLTVTRSTGAQTL